MTCSPPIAYHQLLGMIPTNAGGFGDMEKATQVFIANEVAPIQVRMYGLNGAIGADVFRFSSSVPMS